MDYSSFGNFSFPKWEADTALRELSLSLSLGLPFHEDNILETTREVLD